MPTAAWGQNPSFQQMNPTGKGMYNNWGYNPQSQQFLTGQGRTYGWNQLTPNQQRGLATQSWWKPEWKQQGGGPSIAQPAPNTAAASMSTPTAPYNPYASMWEQAMQQYQQPTQPAIGQAYGNDLAAEEQQAQAQHDAQVSLETGQARNWNQAAAGMAPAAANTATDWTEQYQRALQQQQTPYGPSWEQGNQGYGSGLRRAAPMPSYNPYQQQSYNPYAQQSYTQQQSYNPYQQQNPYSQLLQGYSRQNPYAQSWGQANQSYGW